MQEIMGGAAFMGPPLRIGLLAEGLGVWKASGQGPPAKRNQGGGPEDFDEIIFGIVGM